MLLNLNETFKRNGRKRRKKKAGRRGRTNKGFLRRWPRAEMVGPLLMPSNQGESGRRGLGGGGIYTSHYDAGQRPMQCLDSNASPAPSFNHTDQPISAIIFWIR